jgi:cell division protein FtsQ
MNPFKGSSRNRRRRSGFTLNLRADTEGGARSTGRRTPLAARLGGLLLAGVAAWVVLLVGAAMVREHWLDHIEALAIRKIVITRDGVLSEAEIRTMTGVSPGRNCLTIDVYEIRQRLLRHPRIAEASLYLDFPDTLRVEVKEHLPVARAPLPGGTGSDFFLLDENGRVMERAAATAPAELVKAEAALPLLTGLGSSSFTAGEALSDPQARAALALIALGEGPAAAGTDLVSVDVGTPGVLLALTAKGERLSLLPDDLPRQLRDWTFISQRAAALGSNIASVDLSVQKNIPLRWETNGPVAPQPQRPPHIRRRPPTRHV